VYADSQKLKPVCKFATTNIHWTQCQKQKCGIQDNKGHHSSMHIRRENEAHRAGGYQQLTKPGTRRKAASVETAW
jgi:hypothetical protein